MNIINADFLSIEKVAILLEVVLSLLFIVYFIERCIFLHKGHANPLQFIDGIKTLITNGRTNEALTVCEAAHGPVAIIVKTAIVYDLKKNTNTREIVEAAAALEIPPLEKRLNSIKIIAQASSMIALIAAASMFAQAFSDMQKSTQYFKLNEIAATVNHMIYVIIFGLFLNVLATIGYSFLLGRVKRIVRNLQWTCNEILTFLNCHSNGQK